jgi:hypothetical protein
MKRAMRLWMLGLTMASACVVPTANAGGAEVVHDWTVLRWTGDGAM